MVDQISGSPGIASLVIPMPGSVRVPSNDAETMITWLSAHGAPRNAEVLTRLQRHGWTVEVTDPDLARQCELRASAGFTDLEQARAAARPFRRRVGDQMRWMPADCAGEPTYVSLTDDSSR